MALNHCLGTCFVCFLQKLFSKILALSSALASRTATLWVGLGFKTSMVTMNMFQVNDPENIRGHILDLVFVVGQLQGDLALEDINVSWFTWTNHSEVALWLIGTIYLHGEARSVGLTSHPR